MADMKDDEDSSFGMTLAVG